MGGTIIHQNWVYNQGTSSSGALYPDEGSAYMNFSSNVVTNIGSSKWLHLWNPSIHDVAVQQNWADTSKALNRGTNCPMIDNRVFSAGEIPREAQDIMDASGVLPSGNPFAPQVFNVEGIAPAVVFA